MADFTHKEQPLLGPIALAGMAATRAGLTGIVSVHLDAERASQMGFVDEQAMQFGKRPFGGVPVGFPLLFARLLAVFALHPLADVGQVFQSD